MMLTKAPTSSSYCSERPRAASRPESRRASGIGPQLDQVSEVVAAMEQLAGLRVGIDPLVQAVVDLGYSLTASQLHLVDVHEFRGPDLHVQAGDDVAKDLLLDERLAPRTEQAQSVARQLATHR
jgi:hypothetical protein